MDTDGDNQFHGSQQSNYPLVMRTAILCLSGVIILVALLHLYAHCLARRFVGTDLSGEPGVAIIVGSGPEQYPKHSLGASMVAALPLFSYQQRKPDCSERRECAVCLCSFEEGEMARLLPNCLHFFHVECIDMWLYSHSTCPVCRSAAEPTAELKGNRFEPIGSSSLSAVDHGHLQLFPWKSSV
ncbi:E3 ubiquitin-protein ligase ATL41-like [Nymphaea colorata]|nr:E3 ubiquitin-protein ligase ATL41-like [Nymphaea colorata]